MRSLLPVFLLLFAFTVRAQAPLLPGDRVPDIKWKQVWERPGEEISLHAFGDKLVILDFWASWCTGCLQEFRSIDSLQQKFNKDLQVILVNAKNTNDNEKRIRQSLSTVERAIGRKLQLPLVYSDTAAMVLFPSAMLPHLVWIRKGRVLAITDGEQLTGTNLEAVLRGELRVDQKREIDKSRPIYTIRELPADQLHHYSILLKGRQPGLNGSKQNRYRGDTITGKLVTNYPLVELYRVALNFRNHDPRYLKVNAADSASLIAPDTELERKAWNDLFLYSYELDVPVRLSSKVNDIMLNDLNLYSGYKGGLEKKLADCYVLYRVASAKTEKSKQKAAISSSEDIIEFLKTRAFLQWPVLNEARGVKVNMDLPLNAGSMKELMEWLWQNGFELRKKKRELEFLTIIRQ